MSLMGFSQLGNSQGNYCHQCMAYSCIHMMQNQQQISPQELQRYYANQSRSATPASEITKPEDQKLNKKLLLLTE